MNAEHWIEISQSALRNNVAELQRYAAGRELLLVVKANAYGHGLAEIIPPVVDSIKIFGVSNIEEAEELRNLAPSARILILSPIFSSDVKKILEENFEICISHAEEARRLERDFPGQTSRSFQVHAKLDIGMGRLGATLEEWPLLLQFLASSQAFSVIGIMSHFPSADEDKTATLAQQAFFEQACEIARQHFPQAKDIHVNNSAAMLQGIQGSDSLVRIGLALYGVSPMPQVTSQLIPVLSWKTRIVLLRDMPAGSTISYGMTHYCPKPCRIAIIPVGYAHGYPRSISGSSISGSSASGTAEVLLHGRTCPVLGRVTMNSMMVDVTELPQAQVGDEVVLIGRSGEKEISAWKLARWAGTIPWEIFTNMRSRAKRVVED